MKILGIELGSWSVKAVEMETRFRRTEIIDLHEVMLPLEKKDVIGSYKAAVEQIIARLPTPPEKIVTSLPSAHTALRFFQVPVKSLKKVEQMYRFELEDSVPFKLEDCLTEHHSVKAKDGSVVFAAITPKKHVQSYLDWLKQINLDPDWLTFEGMGCINIFLSSETKEAEPPSDNPILLLDIGHTKTNLSILKDNQLMFFRSLNWGGLSLTQAIALNSNLSLTEADHKKIHELDLSLVLNTLREKEQDLLICGQQTFGTLLTEVNHCLVSYRSQYKQEVGSIILTGGTSQTKGIQSFIEKNLSKPARLFDAFRAFPVKEELRQDRELRFAEALGRSIVFARNSALLFNFRKEELAKSNSLNEIEDFLKNPKILRALKYGGIFAAILFVYALIATPLAQWQSDSAKEELKKVFNDTFPTVNSKLKASLASDPSGMRKFIQNKNLEVDQKLRLLSKGHLTALKMIKGVSDAFPPTSKVDVNNFNVEGEKLTLEGVLYAGELTGAVEALKKLPYVKTIELQMNGQRFTFKGTLVR